MMDHSNQMMASTIFRLETEVKQEQRTLHRLILGHMLNNSFTIDFLRDVKLVASNLKWEKFFKKQFLIIREAIPIEKVKFMISVKLWLTRPRWLL